jgi:hypothetical protein
VMGQLYGRFGGLCGRRNEVLCWPHVVELRQLFLTYWFLPFTLHVTMWRLWRLRNVFVVLFLKFRYRHEISSNHSFHCVKYFSHFCRGLHFRKKCNLVWINVWDAYLLTDVIWDNNSGSLRYV